MPVVDLQGLIDDRVSALRKFHESTGALRAEIDLSGGVDSAVMLALLARAVGPEAITAVYIGIHSTRASRDRAHEVAATCGVKLIDLDVTAAFDALVATMRQGMIKAGYSAAELDDRMQRQPVVLGSIRSCLRAPVGRGCNRLAGGGIRHGTGNECEDRWLRFYQKGGDGEVDTNPIAMLAKGEVYQLARAIGVPASVIEAAPSPDLHNVGDKHTDEDEIRALSGIEWTYSRLDVATGCYRRVGSIEIMSRVLDRYPELIADRPLTTKRLEAIARASRPLFGRSFGVVLGMLESCRTLERMTRHKANPNCPSLGVRSELVVRGILTNELPAPQVGPGEATVARGDAGL